MGVRTYSIGAHKVVCRRPSRSLVCPNQRRSTKDGGKGDRKRGMRKYHDRLPPIPLHPMLSEVFELSEPRHGVFFGGEGDFA